MNETAPTGVAFRALELRDIPALSELLTRAFGLDPSHPNVAPTFLKWKYIFPRPGWPRGRAYLFEKDGSIIAHCGTWPVRFRLPDGTSIESFSIMDWASYPPLSGAGGVRLLRKVMEMTPTSYLVGGSHITRKLLPRVGFRLVGEAPMFSASLRPWREFCKGLTSRNSVRRVLQGWRYKMRKPRQADGHWVCVRVSEFDHTPQEILNDPKRSWTISLRTAADLNFMLECPSVEVQGFQLWNRGKILGYFLIAKSVREARLLTLHVDSEDAEDWCCACRLVILEMWRDESMCQIRALATLPILSQVLLQCGYRRQDNQPIFLSDPSHALGPAPEFAFDLFNGDSGIMARM
jgi:Acetyltransferase (GNAT) domain